MSAKSGLLCPLASQYSNVARVPFTALLYAKISQQILALNHNLFKTLLIFVEKFLHKGGQ